MFQFGKAHAYCTTNPCFNSECSEKLDVTILICSFQQLEFIVPVDTLKQELRDLCELVLNSSDRSGMLSVVSP